MKELRKTKNIEENLLYQEVMSTRPAGTVDRTELCSNLEKKLATIASRLGFSVPALLEEVEHSSVCSEEYDEVRTLQRHIGLLKFVP